MRHVTWAIVGALALMSVGPQACSASKPSELDDTNSSSGSSSGIGGGLSSSGVGGGLSSSSGTGGGDSCAETSSEAQEGVLPADIIVVVDNSGSMTDESALVQNSMNEFSAIITNSGIDAHVVLISSDSTDKQGICVPAPLGSGGCPGDEKLPTFRHVVQEVASSNSFDLILSTYDQWKSSLRPGATKTIAVISDDNSSMSANDFKNALIAKDPSFEGFKFDAIVAPYEVLNPLVCMNCSLNMLPCEQCDPCCGKDTGSNLFCVPLPAEEGKVYKELVAQTQGILGNLCTQQFLPMFQDMATAVVSSSLVACTYNIPDPPKDEMIDYGKVNVEYKPNPGAPAQLIYYVPGGKLACDGTGGWYYDDPNDPKQIILCPATCDLVQQSPEGKVTIKLGCETVIK